MCGSCCPTWRRSPAAGRDRTGRRRAGRAGRDGAGGGRVRDELPYPCVYVRRGGGTAIQRNIGIDAAQGEFIAFIDDDIRLQPDFFERIVAAFRRMCKAAGGIAGYITNQHLDPSTSARWRWYRRLHLFRTYEPGRYDYQTGYPINRYLQPPHDRLKEIDFMGAGCAMWRREVFEGGLRFSEFFKDYGILEDAHLALRARRQWKLFELGTAHCIHLRCQISKPDSRRIARKTASELPLRLRGSGSAANVGAGIPVLARCRQSTWRESSLMRSGGGTKTVCGRRSARRKEFWGRHGCGWRVGRRGLGALIETTNATGRVFV